MKQLLVNTGFSENQRRDSGRIAAANAWVSRLWEEAECENREARWDFLPEEAYERIEDGERLAKTDLDFLFDNMHSASSSVLAAVAAIRLIGILAEENRVPCDLVVPELVHALRHEQNERRYFAIKALWQAGARSAVPAILKLSTSDGSERIRRIAERAIEVLK